MLGNAKINKKLDFQEAVRIAQAFLRYRSLVAQAYKRSCGKSTPGRFPAYLTYAMKVPYVALQKLAEASALLMVVHVPSFVSL